MFLVSGDQTENRKFIGAVGVRQGKMRKSLNDFSLMSRLLLHGETVDFVKTAVVQTILVFFVTTENPQTNLNGAC